MCQSVLPAVVVPFLAFTPRTSLAVSSTRSFLASADAVAAFNLQFFQISSLPSPLSESPSSRWDSGGGYSVIPKYTLSKYELQDLEASSPSYIRAPWMPGERKEEQKMLASSQEWFRAAGSHSASVASWTHTRDLLPGSNQWPSSIIRGALPSCLQCPSSVRRFLLLVSVLGTDINQQMFLCSWKTLRKENVSF